MAIKEKISKFQKHLADIAKISEKELRKISQSGQYYFDATAIHLKKEHLYYLIGKEYIRVHKKNAKGNKLQELLDEYYGAHKDHNFLKKQLEKKVR